MGGDGEVFCREVQNADTKECGPAPAPRFRESLHAQWIPQVAQGSGPLLQHSRRAAEVRAGRSWREGNLLAGAGESRDDESKAAWEFETHRQAGGHGGGVSQDSHRRLFASGKVVTRAPDRI